MTKDEKSYLFSVENRDFEFSKELRKIIKDNMKKNAAK